ncbi:MAG: DNA polymerase III subunit chi [Pseudomonas sp.]|jgi:DNA polymerase III subunit chi|uniref:DNA polymerase III chi subunit n=1 Tax=Stutzerimonas stutzeri TaxID=316 RepID=A0A5S5B7Q1_STUST|nr:DNA polymerase III subunit chi [Stutzerimonas stutzeri]MAX93522.1 DNA polymerase III subunit chi [Pseudomonas sp.]MBK60328.1 DNA polymerase III subunit chi [Pseudomonas sp.]TYP61980.1 DNA polymerase III chi subunit [Stutzerimonas stutzeri]HAQ86481.1 DNA polymerase III subunit chi [Pseudomonas sp.]HAW23645.1 DNA polymerase III subunit chi [Pseudomonas sp.]|tara:strand:- start:38247 stop:38666 length:420 start_codon:yes stop_codon:yes gene_type:complete
MTRIEFYVLPDSEQAGRARAACQLASKGWQHGLPVFIRCQDDQQCNELDELLWTFRAERFIPHELHGVDPLAPVVIGTEQPPASVQGLLINLSPTLSPHTDQFSRVIEIVNQQPELLTVCRDNFRLYRQRGYDPKRVEL